MTQENEKKDVTIYDLENILEEQLKTRDIDYGIDTVVTASNTIEAIDERRYEALSEIVDGIVPIYNYDLLTVACSDLWLACEDTEQDSKNAIDCLRETIARHLQEKADEFTSK